MIADSGYGWEENLEHLESEKRPERRIEAFIAKERQKHGERKVARRGPLPKGATRVERMKRKLLTKVGASVYAARKGIVEPVFGQIKQGRGFRGFSLRGFEKVKAEWALVCATHNLLKMYRVCRSRKAQLAGVELARRSESGPAPAQPPDESRLQPAP